MLNMPALIVSKQDLSACESVERDAIIGDFKHLDVQGIRSQNFNTGMETVIFKLPVIDMELKF